MCVCGDGCVRVRVRVRVCLCECMWCGWGEVYAEHFMLFCFYFFNAFLIQNLILQTEAELGGPIHTKAMMILKSYLVDQFAHNKPLVLTGSLCFEQSYNGIEGDSASGAELVSLLSAIAKVPIKLSLAITGAISQAGAILPVGGVTRKIEGFFNLCNRRGLTGEQGVIIPKDNIEHLMLDQKVLKAVEENKFSIYGVSHITEALELLTNVPAGKRYKNGSFAENTLFHAVDTQLHELGWFAENSFKTRKKKKIAKITDAK